MEASLATRRCDRCGWWHDPDDVEACEVLQVPWDEQPAEDPDDPYTEEVSP